MSNIDPEEIFLPRESSSDLIVGAHSILMRNGITFNDRRSLECYFVEKFTGFNSSKLIVGSEQDVQADRELPDPGFHGGRTMTMTGFIRAGDYPRAMKMSRALLDSFVTLVEKQMVISVADGSSIFTQPDYQIFCRLADEPQVELEPRQEDMSGIFKRNFTVALHATDPVYQSVVEKYTQLEPTFTSTYGRSYDRFYDLAYNVVEGGGGTSHYDTLINLGNWDAAPRIRFNGFMNGIALINNANGHLIRLKYPISSGDYIEIDVATGEITNSLGENASDYFDTSSDWMFFQGKRDEFNGENVVSLSVTDFDSNGSVEIWWRDSMI